MVGAPSYILYVRNIYRDPVATSLQAAYTQSRLQMKNHFGAHMTTPSAVQPLAIVSK